MPTITIKISTDNAAFDPNPEIEVARILTLLALNVGDEALTEGIPWLDNRALLDIDGNVVGSVRITKR